MANGSSMWSRATRWLRSWRIRRLSQEQYLKRVWAILFIIGVLSISIGLWQDGVILVKGVPVLTTLGATILAVTLSSMLSWRVQLAWHERTELKESPGVRAP